MARNRVTIHKANADGTLEVTIPSAFATSLGLRSGDTMEVESATVLGSKVIQYKKVDPRAAASPV